MAEYIIVLESDPETPIPKSSCEAAMDYIDSLSSNITYELFRKATPSASWKSLTNGFAGGPLPKLPPS